MNEQVTRAAVYERVTNFNTAIADAGLDEQRRFFEEYCRQYNWTIVLRRQYRKNRPNLSPNDTDGGCRA